MRSPSPLRPSPDVVSRQLGDGAVLVDLATNTIFELNATGARIWALLDQQFDMDRIAETLVSEFEVTSSDASAAVRQLLTDLETAGLLRP